MPPLNSFQHQEMQHNHKRGRGLEELKHLSSRDLNLRQWHPLAFLDLTLYAQDVRSLESPNTLDDLD